MTQDAVLSSPVSNFATLSSPNAKDTENLGD